MKLALSNLKKALQFCHEIQGSVLPSSLHSYSWPVKQHSECLPHVSQADRNCARLDKPRSRVTETSKQAIIPWVSEAEGCWGLVLRKHTGEATDPICQGLEGSQKQWKLTTDQRATGMKITCACLVFGCRGNVPKCVSGDGKRGKEKAHIYPTARENKPFRNNVQKAWGSRWNTWIISFHSHKTTHSPSECLNSVTIPLGCTPQQGDYELKMILLLR